MSAGSRHGVSCPVIVPSGTICIDVRAAIAPPPRVCIVYRTSATTKNRVNETACINRLGACTSNWHVVLGCDFTERDFTDCDFNECDFTERDFTDCDFNECDFTGCDFTECDFTGCVAAHREGCLPDCA